LTDAFEEHIIEKRKGAIGVDHEGNKGFLNNFDVLAGLDLLAFRGSALQGSKVRTYLLPRMKHKTLSYL